MIDPLFAFTEAAIAALWSTVRDTIVCAMLAAFVLFIVVFFRGGALGLAILSICLIALTLVFGALR